MLWHNSLEEHPDAECLQSLRLRVSVSVTQESQWCQWDELPKIFVRLPQGVGKHASQHWQMLLAAASEHNTLESQTVLNWLLMSCANCVQWLSADRYNASLNDCIGRQVLHAGTALQQEIKSF